MSSPDLSALACILEVRRPCHGFKLTVFYRCNFPFFQCFQHHFRMMIRYSHCLILPLAGNEQFQQNLI
jgi:hypothetical protein